MEINNLGTYISTASAVGVVGSSVYFYKRTNELQDNIDELEESVKKTETIATELAKKVMTTEMSPQLVNELKSNLNEVSKLKKAIRQIRLFVASQDEKYNSIIEALSKHDIKITSSKPVSQKKKSKSKKKDSDYESDTEADSESESDDDITKAILKIRK